MSTPTDNILSNLDRHSGTFSVAAGHRDQAIREFGSDAAFAAFNRSGNSGLPSAGYVERHRAAVRHLVETGVLNLDEHHTAGGAAYVFTTA